VTHADSPFRVDVLDASGDVLGDGLAARISLIANAVLLIVLWVTNYLGCREAFEEIVSQLGIALPAVYAILVAALGAKGAHRLMKGIDAKSFSFSAR